VAISRRAFIASAAVAVPAITVAGTEAARAASAAGDVVGKISVGYQGWFACIGDGSPINAWWHWAPNAGASPSPSNNGIKSWPDMREYTKSYHTAFANLGNGSAANLYSDYDDQTINIQFTWMQQNGIDTAALQRFNPTGGEGPIRDAVTAKVRTAAEASGRKFYIMYDVSGWTNMQSEIKTDWTNKMKAYTSSSAYAVQNGKPVVCIWGFGFNDTNHNFSADVCLDVINWFKNAGCYVIGGVPTHWRTQDSDSRAGFINTYHAFNMISPWMVGRIGNVGDVDNFYTNVQTQDQADCNANGIDYQPCVLPGDNSVRQRAHGDFMWRQFYNMKRLGVQGIYISMFDEFNEGNQIAKTAENSSMIPTDSGILGLNEDGTVCSSDYYLRLTGDGGKMLKGQIALTATRPTQPVAGTSTPTPTTTTTVPTTGAISLKAQANGLFVCADNAGASALIANRTAAGGWETFDVVDLGSGNIALKSRANGLYVCADNAGASPLIANRTAIGGWETFTLVTNSNGTVSLKAQANGLYVCADNAGASALIANRTAIGGWESFTKATV
jgi:hypothetical protein